MHASFYLMWLTLVCAAESVVSRGESSIRPLTRYWASFAWMSHSCELKPLLIKATIGTWQRLFSRPQHAGVVSIGSHSGGSPFAARAMSPAARNCDDEGSPGEMSCAGGRGSERIR